MKKSQVPVHIKQLLFDIVNEDENTWFNMRMMLKNFKIQSGKKEKILNVPVTSTILIAEQSFFFSKKTKKKQKM